MAGRQLLGPLQQQQRVAKVVSRGRRSLSSKSATAADADSGRKALVTGSAAGFCGSLIGLGGGFVAIPLLTGWLRLTQHQAHATSLGAVVATGAAGAAGFAAAGHVDWKSLPPMVVAGMVASSLGAKASGAMSQSTLKRTLGGFMIAVAPVVIFRDQLLELALAQGAEARQRREAAATAEVAVPGQAQAPLTRRLSAEAPLAQRGETDPLRMAVIGAASGFLSGVFGVGGGAVTVPAIALCTDFSHKEALGLSLAAMVLPAVTGGFVHYRAGNLLPRVALPLAVGTAVGAYTGSKYVVQHVSNDALKIIFAAFMAGLGYRTFRSAGPLRRAVAAAGRGGGIGGGAAAGGASAGAAAGGGAVGAGGGGRAAGAAAKK